MPLELGTLERFGVVLVSTFLPLVERAGLRRLAIENATGTDSRLSVVVRCCRQVGRGGWLRAGPRRAELAYVWPWCRLSRLDEALHEYRRRSSQGRCHQRGRASCRHRMLACLQKRQLESWNPNPVFKKGKPEFSTDSPMQPSRASAQILRQYAPLRLLSVGSIAAHRVLRVRRKWRR